MPGYNIRVDLSELLDANSALVQSLFPNITAAVQMVAEEAALRWKNAVMKARLWSGEKQPYVESIKWTMTGDFEAEVTTDYKFAGEIETGRPPRDLKRAISTSSKARTVGTGAHKGQRYLIIPFRHNVPTAAGEGGLAPQMPPHVYARARVLAPSLVVANAGGQRVYKWGGRLSAGLVPKLKRHHQTDPYASMVRFATSTGKAKSSAYLTFRTMGQWSPGWIVGARPGLHLAQDVAEGLQPVLEEAVGKAVTLGALRK